MKAILIVVLALLLPAYTTSLPSSLRGNDFSHTNDSADWESSFFQKGSLASWLEENIWDHPLLTADQEVFQLPASLVTKKLDNYGDNDDDSDAVKPRLRKLDKVPVNNGEDLVVSVTFREIYKTIFFIAFAWLLGTLSVYIGLPSLVGEIVAGFLLGPPLADFVPFPGALVLAGNIGLIGLILESGIGLDVAQLKEVGTRALLMAIVGSSLPLLTGFGVGKWIGKPTKKAIAMGAAFAPSSLGVASAALSTGEVLNTPIGQLIVASSVFDDVFGLILLSILEVFADPSPTTFDYILPFLASFGYLIVLGFLGITAFPKIIERKVLPLVAEGNRDQVAMVMMLMLMSVYMLALNYSGASYLTGVFLAGMTFSQINSVHISFVKYARPILEWLLRIFFAATIGFQVPIKFFADPFVIKWGCALLLPVFAKIPLGFLVPHFQQNIPDDFPYNPYYRDVIVTSLSMMCRGEFNFIVASYALSQGLFKPEAYAAVIFAVLFGSIVCPLVLSKILKYYNNLSRGYLEGKHPIERIGKTNDGYRPLFLAIQARTPVHWSLQEAFERILAEQGLLIIDHRSWHTLGNGKGAVDITELFVQDTKVRVRVKGCFGSSSSRPSKKDLVVKVKEDSTRSTATGTADELFGAASTQQLQPPTTAASQFAVDDRALVKRKERRQNRKKAVSASAAIQEMRDMFTMPAASSPPLDSIRDSIRTEEGKEAEEEMLTPPTTAAPHFAVDDFAKRKERRQNRKKAVSASAAIQEMRDMFTMPTASSPPLDSIRTEEGREAEEEILARCEEVKEALSKCLGHDNPEDYVIQVSQWEAFVVDKTSTEGSEESEGTDSERQSQRKCFYSLHSFGPPEEEEEEAGDKGVEETQEGISSEESLSGQPQSSSNFLQLLQRSASRDSTTHHRHARTSSHIDLWEIDNAVHDACREGYILSPDCKGYGVQNITEGLGLETQEAARPPSRLRSRNRHNRTVSFDPSVLSSHVDIERDRETDVICDRLHGYVRKVSRPLQLPES